MARVPRILETEHLAAYAKAAVERRQRHVELLKAPAEDHREQMTERPVHSAPLRPHLETVGRGALVETRDF